MRVFRIISGVTLISGSGWLGPWLADLFGASTLETYSVALVGALGGTLIYSGLPFAGKKTVKVGRF